MHYICRNQFIISLLNISLINTLEDFEIRIYVTKQTNSNKNIGEKVNTMGKFYRNAFFNDFKSRNYKRNRTTKLTDVIITNKNYYQVKDAYNEFIDHINIHVIIGRNGVGKTYLISNMIRSIIQPRSDNRDNVGETRFLHDRQTAEDHFSRIIFVSFSAFDELNFKTRSKKFVRIGLPAHSDEDSTYTRLNETFATSFSACLHGPQRSLLIKVLNMLKSDPMFSESGIIDYCEEDNKYNNDDLKSVFSRLSSGHKIILLSITQLIEKVMEKTLVFLDEPEGHLHPPLLSAFIRALSELLLDKNGVAIIATHSPVILQEVPRSCIWKLRRTGAHCKAERLNIESFGADITTLTTEVFGLEVINSGFHSLLQELVNRYGTYDRVLRKLNGQLGAEGRALVKTMVMLNEKDEDQSDEDS